MEQENCNITSITGARRYSSKKVKKTEKKNLRKQSIYSHAIQEGHCVCLLYNIGTQLFVAS